MEISILSLFVTGAITLLYLAYKSMMKPKNFPPGPVGIPFLGSMHHLTDFPSNGMYKLTKKYGNIFSLKLFHVDVVCVCGYEANREIFVKNSSIICDRPLTISMFFKGNPLAGITEGEYGSSWAANRRVFHQTIRELGSHGVEKIVQKEVSFMIQEIEKMLSFNKAVDPSDVVAIGVLNVIAAIVFGNRFDYADEKMLRLLHLNNEGMTRYVFALSIWSSYLITIYPQITKLWFPKAVKDFVAVEKNLCDFIFNEIKTRKENFDPDSPRDYIDYYLIKMKENEGKSKSFTDHQLRIAILDMFQAGSETTATTIRFAMLYLAGHQEIQTKIHKEIEQVIDTEEPNYDHRLKMPYTEATMHEVIRFSSIVPAGLLRKATQDTDLLGYNIPKGTWVWPHLISSNFQTDQWKKPTEFDPENFLDESGKFVQNDALVAFGGGVRICLGMFVAKQEIFLFLVSLMQRFAIKPEKDGMKMNYEQIPGLTMTPKPFKIRLIEKS